LKEHKKLTATIDGQTVLILANVGDIEDCNLARNKNVDGIGIVRTELLFASKSDVPNEKEQFLTYLKIVKKMRKKPIIFRTADFGGDKIPGYKLEGYSDSIEQSRGIRHSLLNKEEFMVQIRSLLQIARYGDLSITFPMVYSIDDIKQAKAIINKVRLEFQNSRVMALKELKIGAFIETREAIQDLGKILKEVSFINIGTNDLFQEVMGFDRLRGNCSECEYLEPEFLKVLKGCIVKAKKRGKRIIICGEMAAEPLAAILLIGMGADELSMSPSKTAEIRATIRKISFIESKKLYEKVIRCSSSIDVKNMVNEWINGVESD
jgi:phosphoenolpyruvate-protein phosphotransferase (PTS system enzyme I)